VALEVCMAIFHTATSDANKIPHNKANDYCWWKSLNFLSDYIRAIIKKSQLPFYKMPINPELTLALLI
jgi:hypothetical protein